MSTFIKSQVKNNLDTQENYKCNKCNDRTFILIDNEAVPCECRALREAESILKHSGISKEFSKKTFDNFDYSRNILDSEVYNKYLNRYNNARVHLIDDLFKGNITPSDINIIFEIINYRYFNNKPIIVSTEKYKSDLLKIDEAIGSRILEMCDKFNIEVRGKGLNYRIYG